MNREEKLKFIKEMHPELYTSLAENVPAFVDDVWNADSRDISLYNSWVAFYCGQIQDVDLMNKLLI